MTRPHLTGVLGSYGGREEFQVGRVIVWVQVPAYGNKAAWLELADQQFELVWQAVPAVVSFAQSASRAAIPAFWQAHDTAGTAGEQLAVWGIWIDPATGSADYEVGCNHDFNCSTNLPELPDGHSVMVTRDASGGLAARVLD